MFLSYVLEGCITGLSPKKYLLIDYCIGQGCEKIMHVCREAFKFAYEITEFTLQFLTDSIKHQRFAQVAKLTDRINLSSKLSFAEIKQKNDRVMAVAQELGIIVTKEQLAAMNLPNVPKYVHAYAWLSRYFYLVGDQQPNSEQIQLDPITVDELYKLYIFDNEGKVDAISLVTKEKLGKVWLTCFP
jgi:hypothetical protein